MKTKIALLVCAVLLGGCASYSGTYRQQLAYGDSGYDENPYYGDDAYSDDAYYDDDYYRDDYVDDGYVDDFYGGGFYGGGFGVFGYGGNYGYCAPHQAFCAGDPLSVFLFPIGGGRYWLMFDGYRNWPSYGYGGYGYGYGYGWPGWGFPHDDWDHGRDHHHHHHHQDGNPPPVTQTPPPGTPPPVRLFVTPRPRKGVYTPNSMPRPQPTEQVGDDNQVPRGRRSDDGSGGPPMRWRRPGTVAAPPSDTGAGFGGRSDLADRPEPVAPPERTRTRDPDPPSRPESTPDRQPSSARDNSDEAAVRNRRHGDGGGH